MWIGKYYFFLPQLLISQIYAVDSKLLNLDKVLLCEIIFYIVCAGVSDIDIDRCRNGWDNLFRKSSVIKECGDRNILVIKISKK